MISERKISEAYFGQSDKADAARVCGTAAPVDRDGELARLCFAAGTPDLFTWFIFAEYTIDEALARIRSLH